MFCLCASGYHTDHTSVGGVSSRLDSKVHLALVDGGYIYTPLNLAIGADHNCIYQVYVNNTLYEEGEINVSERGFIDLRVVFEEGGWQNFTVMVSNDQYDFYINVLKRSYEEVITDEVREQVEELMYGFNTIMKVYGASVVGTFAGIFVAYIFKIDKLRTEARRIL